MWGSRGGARSITPGQRRERRRAGAAPAAPGLGDGSFLTLPRDFSLPLSLREGSAACPPAQIILQSMHKYKPRVHVIAQDSRFDLAQIQSLPAEGVQTFSFQETEFTTVTAYQNQQVPGAGGTESPGGWRAPMLPGLPGSQPAPLPGDSPSLSPCRSRS